MGALGGFLLLCGIGMMLLGIAGIGINLWFLHWADAGYSALLAIAGLVAGTIGITILE